MITMSKKTGHNSETLQRVLVAVVCVPAILLIVFVNWLHFLPFALLISGIIFVASMEYQQILKYKWISDYRVPFLIMSALIPVSFWLATWMTIPGLPEMVMVLCFTALAVPQMLKTTFLESFSYVGYYFMGLFFISWCASHLITLANMPDGAYLLFILFGGIWISDSLAYFAGVAIWKDKAHKVPWKVSPNKTFEGYAAGLLGAILAVFIVNIIFSTGWTLDLKLFKISLTAGVFGWAKSVLAGTVIFIFGSLGDLFESVLKRSVNIKDSGNFLPGHGGPMDRFDSIFLTAPVFTLLIRFISG